MTSVSITERVVEVPAELAQSSAGFSLDIGSSVCKAVYRHKEDWEAFKHGKKKTKAKLRLASIAAESSSTLFDVLSGSCDINRDKDPPPLIYTAGAGSNVHAASIEEKLGVKLQNLSEFECFVGGFIYMAKNTPLADFVFPLNQQVLEETYKVVKDKNDAFVFLVHGANPDPKALERPPAPKLPLPLSQNVEFPCLLAMCGSAFGFIKVYENGEYKLFDGSNNGGKSLLGMGSLLLGVKGYDELLDLASHGNNRHVDLYPQDLAPSGSDDDYDKAIAVQDNGDVIFHFGKAVGKNLEDFSREDLAMSLVEMAASQLSQDVMYAALRAKVSHIYFCGSYVNAELMRDAITANLTNRMMFVNSLSAELNAYLGFHFLQCGSHLGAIGALTNNLTKVT